MLALLADAYVHRLDPFAIRITSGFGIRWYGLAYAAGFVIAWLFIRWMARRGRSPLTIEAVGDLMFHVIAGVLLGGRLGYAVFYDPSLLYTFRPSFPWWDLLAITRGGMASHGGIIGVILACTFFGRRRHVSALHLLDLGAFSCTAGLFLGRLANFVNGELWGRALPPERQADPPWWSIKYPEEILPPNGLALTPDVEARLRALVGGQDTFLVNVVEAVRAGNAEVIETLRPLLTAFHPSQIIQAATDGPILAGALALIWLRPRKPGIVGAWFLVVYGVLRIATEFVRQPDPGVGLLAGLSRGQVLSILMVVAGAIAVVICARRDAPLMGGLGRGAAVTAGAAPSATATGSAPVPRDGAPAADADERDAHGA